MSSQAMDPIETEYEALMAAVDSDVDAGGPESALARLEEFIQKHVRPEDEWLGLWVLIEANGDGSLREKPGRAHDKDA